MTIAPLDLDESPHPPRLVGERQRPRRGGPTVEDARILVVDDDPHAVRHMRRLLERDGFRLITTAGDGHHAVAIALQQRPEVMILDVHMPRVNGYQVLDQLHDEEPDLSAMTAVLAISGDPSATTGRSMLRAGADDFISRPFDGRQFALRVRRLANITRELRQTLGYIDWLENRSPPRRRTGVHGSNR